ncbi:hypothetical protein GCM10011579_023220 [Streptomyces albiflavescens]|uniref:Uncharacterized protein n=1 Tax=Streptomyces albiflavescens TaxID=1623582 RepID=A0A917XY59_9ACTN|nr:hypothetical protein [Streptomyces albiflavescens]GGN59140.1 hypothetical protein GCM10011579_023220 [Streptomyces albiflavescens]
MGMGERRLPSCGASRRGAQTRIGRRLCELPLGFDLALERVRTVLVELTPDANPELVEAATDRVTLRVLTAGGALNMNPVVVTVDARRNGERTALHVRAMAKEGLIKQRAGQKTTERITALLDGASPSS